MIDKNYFLSEYLTHWTGYNRSNEEAFSILKSILSNYRLIMSYSTHFESDSYCTSRLKMVCFTDIPHYLSKQHCDNYGTIGIAFHKDKMKKYGCNPVFYITEKLKKDLGIVYDHIWDLSNKSETKKLPITIALQRYFGFVQDYYHAPDILKSNYDDADPSHYSYYEREWRLLEKCLEYSDISFCQSGMLCKGEYKNNQVTYFQFDPQDIAFIIIPKKMESNVKELVKDDFYSYEIYEEIVE